MGDRIALMKEGRLEQYDTPANILYHPKDEFVEGFVGADRALKGLQLLKVKDVMIRDLVTVTPEDTAQTARERLAQTAGDTLPVVSGSGTFDGWVSAANLPETGAVSDFIQQSSVKTEENAVLNEALSLMLSSRFTWARWA